jgi:hypothetical protein
MRRVLSLLFVLSGCGIDGLTSEDIYGLAPAPRVWVAGIVSDANTGAPLGEVTVQIAGVATTSGHSGAFRIDALLTGPAQGSASREGYEPATFDLDLRAGANQRDLALAPLLCSAVSCPTNQVCDPTSGRCVVAATLTGGVISACTQLALASRVSINGKATCSDNQKPIFQLSGLVPGGPHTLAIYKKGYLPISMPKTLQPGFNTFGTIELMPEAGCGAAPPVDEGCSCTTANCQ